MPRFGRKKAEGYSVKMEMTGPTSGRITIWAVAYGPTIPRGGIWMKVGTFDWNGYSQFAEPCT